MDMEHVGWTDCYPYFTDNNPFVSVLSVSYFVCIKNDGLVLVDAGLGRRDYVDEPGILWTFKLTTIVSLNPEEAAIRQITKQGYQPEDVRHIVLTHMHFDHAGGLPDFPWAKVHVHRCEHEAIKSGRFRRWADGGYNRRILDHDSDIRLYEETGDKWNEFDAIRLTFEPEMYLLPLHGHSDGHCGVAVKDGDERLLHVGDAASFAEDAPGWLVKFALGPHQPRLREFGRTYPEVCMTMGHMKLEFFMKPRQSARYAEKAYRKERKAFCGFLRELCVLSGSKNPVIAPQASHQ